MDNVKNPNLKHLAADIVIIGGGGAGLPAAVSAAEAGVKRIIVLEGLNILGGDARLAQGMWAVESPAQKRIGVNYTTDQAFKEKMDAANWEVDPKVVRTFVNASGMIIKWLEDKGLIFNDVISFVAEGEGPKVYHGLGPGSKTGLRIMDTLAKECQERGIQILLKTKAKKILTDEEGKVAGVVAINGKEEIQIASKSVVIASGGFAGNKKLMDKYFPSHGGFRLSLSLPLQGDGLRMAEELGAISNELIVTNWIGPHHYPYSASLNNLLRLPNMIVVNKLGERFYDESLWVHARMHQAGNSVARQPGEMGYGLVDSATLKSIIQQKVFHTELEKHHGVEWFDHIYDDFIIDGKKGVAKIADTWEEMADFIGAKPEVLKETIQKYNSYCDSGYDADFLKDKWFLSPLRTPPYYAILARNGFDCTIGGIKINQKMEVINEQFCPIVGLYAAGNNAGGCIGRPANPKHPGPALTFALCSGYIAGKSAAEYVLG